MACALLRRKLVLAVFVSSAAYAAEVGEIALEADDECLAENSSACSLAMLQLRRRQVAGVWHDPEKHSGERHNEEHRPFLAQDVDLLQFVSKQDQDPKPGSPCTVESNHPCEAGYRMKEECKPSFLYNGKRYTGCTKDGSISGAPWCSEDENHGVFSNKWEYCIPCTEASRLPTYAWDHVAAQLRCMTVSMIVGTAIGRSYTFENAQERIRKQTWLASAGKWPAVVAIAGSVHAGDLNWDTYVSEVLPWWSRSQEDKRSRITLRNLLQFSSGFQTQFEHDQHGFDLACMRMPRAMFYDIEECARQIYEEAKHVSEPGTTFSYNGYHLQIALAMASKASGKGAALLLNENLFQPAGMTNTMVMGGSNPLVATFMFSTGEDYASFLQKYLTYQILPKHIIDVIETPAGNQPLPDFAMGHAVSGDDHNWGGAMLPHLNRRTGVYTLIMPKVEDYAAYFGLEGQRNFRAEFIGAGMHVWDWIHADVDRLGFL